MLPSAQARPTKPSAGRDASAESWSVLTSGAVCGQNEDLKPADYAWQVRPHPEPQREKPCKQACARVLLAAACSGLVASSA
eukprot:3941538-Rhodomonas_salina.17